MVTATPHANEAPRQWVQQTLRHLPESSWQQKKIDFRLEQKKRVREERVKFAHAPAEPGVLHQAGWRRRSTWEDNFIRHFGRGWRELAANREQWLMRKDEFVYSILEDLTSAVSGCAAAV